MRQPIALRVVIARAISTRMILRINAPLSTKRFLAGYS